MQNLSIYLRQKYDKAYYMDLAKIIKERRDKLGISQESLAQMAEVGIATLKDIERGKGNPRISTVEKIMEVLGMEMEFQIRKTV